MLHTIFNQGLTRCGLHLQHFRLLSIAARKDKFSHTSCCNTLEKYFDQNHSAYSTGIGSNSRWKYKRNTRHSNPLGKLVGALGTVAALGLGTVLSKSEEEKRPCDSETADTIMKTSAKNEETQVGKDVVGTERQLGNEETIISPDTRLHVEPSHSWEVKHAEKQSGHEESIRKARQILRRFAEEVGAPGMVVAVTVNGRQVWADGFGFADLENGVRCSPATVMRIASISKAITMTAVAKLWENGKLDIDAPIQKYIPNFPKKTYNGEEVTITTRHLISHQSGIRHYKLKDSKEENKKKESDQNNNVDNKIQSQTADRKGTEPTSVSLKNYKTSVREESLRERENVSITSKTDMETEKAVVTSSSENENVSNSKGFIQEDSRNQNKKCLCNNRILRRKSKKKKEEEKEDEFDLEEYYIKEEYETVEDALKLFQNDELFFKPGEGYLYTTHGWTVVSAVVEGATKQPFTEVAKRLFYELGLGNTYLDMPSPIIYNRASYYIRDKRGRLKNAPYVDNSLKWAGGGFLSTVGDLCKFGNAMLYASQQEFREDGGDSPKLPGYLKASTIGQLWTPVIGTKKRWLDLAYGMGWQAIPDKHLYQFCRNSRHHAFHSGGAVGASSILLVLPQKEPSSAIPQGVVVAMLANMQGVGMYKVALEIAELFEKSQ